MTARELHALLISEDLRREDLALFLGVDPTKLADWERSAQPLSRENERRIQKAMAEFREARANLQAIGLWRQSEKDKPIVADRAPASTLGSGDLSGGQRPAPRTVEAASRKPHAPKEGPLITLWGALRSSFLFLTL